jgi:hypothetical protein
LNFLSISPELGGVDLDGLDKISAVDMEFPFDFINGPMVRELIHGKTYGLLDLH